jgi:phage gp29-like protein
MKAFRRIRSAVVGVLRKLFPRRYVVAALALPPAQAAATPPARELEPSLTLPQPPTPVVAGSPVDGWRVADPSGVTWRGRGYRGDRNAMYSYLPDPPVTPAAAPKSPRIDIVTTPSRLDYTDSFAGFKLTPDRVASIFRQADAGFPLQMIDMFEHVTLGDGHLRGLFEQRMDEVAAQSWSLRPPDGDDSAQSLAVAQLLTEVLSKIDMEALIEHMMLAMAFGYSYAELAWQTRPDGLQVPTEVVCVPHRRFVFDWERWNPHLTSEGNPYPGTPLADLPGSSWVRAQSKRWRKPTQAGILRTATYWAVFKRMSVRDWLIFAEKFGIPMIIGKYTEESSEKTRKALRDAIASLGTEGRAILGDGQIIEVIDPRCEAAAEITFTQGITALANTEISKVFTAGTLTTDAGGPGSFALGEVHAAQKHKLSLADARRVGNIVSKYISVPFLRRNGIANAQPPWLHIHVQKLSLLQDAQTVQTLASAGLKLSARHQREYFNQPAPSGPDDELQPPVKNASDPTSKPAPAEA